MTKQKPTHQPLAEEEKIFSAICGLSYTDIFPFRDHLVNTRHYCHYCTYRDRNICRPQRKEIAEEIIKICKQAHMRLLPSGHPRNEFHSKRARREVDGDDSENPSYHSPE